MKKPVCRCQKQNARQCPQYIQCHITHFAAAARHKILVPFIAGRRSCAKHKRQGEMLRPGAKGAEGGKQAAKRRAKPAQKQINIGVGPFAHGLLGTQQPQARREAV